MIERKLPTVLQLPLHRQKCWLYICFTNLRFGLLRMKLTVAHPVFVVTHHARLTIQHALPQAGWFGIRARGG